LYAGITQNYVGYKVTITSKNRVQFERFTDSLRRLARAAPEGLPCFQLLYAWIEYFNDNHTGIYTIDGSIKTATVSAFYNLPANGVPVDTVALKQYLLGKGRDSIEGIWENVSYPSRNYIVKDKSKPSHFTCVVLQSSSPYWVPGQIRYHIRKTKKQQYVLGTYYNMYRVAENPGLKINANKLVLTKYGSVWRKVFPPVAGAAEVKRMETYFANEDSIPTLKIIDSNTVLVSVPACRLSFMLIVDSLVKANKSLIERANHLLVDIRNNGGGSRLVFRSLLPYISSGAYYGTVGYMWGTNRNIELYRPTDTLLPEATLKIMNSMVDSLIKYRGNIYTEKADITRPDSIYPKPARVSILVNRFTASAAELFLQDAMQSKKVTVFGENTNGIVDYGDVAWDIKLPCPYFGYYYALYMTKITDGKHYESVGIPPHVQIDPELDDWIGFVMKYYKRKS
jgi:hypothetical protein